MKKGFTLIELLVVISIIGLLSSVVFSYLGAAREKSADTARKQAMRQMQSALNMYFSDNGSYPSTGGNFYGVSVTGGSRPTSGAGGYIPNLAPQYIPVLPTDPAGVTTGWSGYLYRSDGVNYKLLSHISGPTTFPPASTAFYDPLRPSSAFMLCSGEPACSSW